MPNRLLQSFLVKTKEKLAIVEKLCSNTKPSPNKSPLHLYDSSKTNVIFFTSSLLSAVTHCCINFSLTMTWNKSQKIGLWNITFQYHTQKKWANPLYLMFPWSLKRLFIFINFQHEEKEKKNQVTRYVCLEKLLRGALDFQREGKHLKAMLLVWAIISYFSWALRVGITFSVSRYWQGLYWISSVGFPFCLLFKAHLIILKWYFALSTSCEVTCSTFFLSFPLLFLFPGPV